MGALGESVCREHLSTEVERLTEELLEDQDLMGLSIVLL